MPRSPTLSHNCGIASPGQSCAKLRAASPLTPIPAWRNAAQGAPVCLCGTLSKVVQARSSDTAAVQTLVQLTGTLVPHPASVHSRGEKQNSKLVSYHTGSRNYQLWNLSSALKLCSVPSSFLCFSGFYFLLLPVPFPFHITSQPAIFLGNYLWPAGVWCRHRDGTARAGRQGARHPSPSLWTSARHREVLGTLLGHASSVMIEGICSPQRDVLPRNPVQAFVRGKSEVPHCAPHVDVSQIYAPF